MKKLIDAKKAREKFERRFGWKTFYETLGKMVYRAYPYGQIFDIETGQLVVFHERPSLFIKVAIGEAEKAMDEWRKKAER